MCKGQPQLHGSVKHLPTPKVHKLRHTLEIFTEQSGLKTFKFSHSSLLISYTIHLHVTNAVFVCCR